MNRKESDEGELGVVEAVLPKRLFRVRLSDGRGLQAGLSPSAQHSIVRLVAGERVLVSVSHFDPHRGHVLRKL